MIKLDLMTFFSRVISSVAWPLAVVVIVVILRRQLAIAIQALAERLKNLKFPGGEANFTNEVKEVKQIAEEDHLSEVLPETRKTADERIERWLRLAEASPDAVVLEAWHDLEVSLRDIALRLGLPAKDMRNPLALVTALSRRELLDSRSIAMIERLRSLRNEVAHGRVKAVSLSDALDYASVAGKLPPPIPHTFYGSVTINGNPAPIGTTVEARGTGVTIGITGNPITTTQVGRYGRAGAFVAKLVVQGGNIADGATLTFYVNNVAAAQTAHWHSGAISELNLTVTLP